MKISVGSDKKFLAVVILLLAFLTGCVTTEAKHNNISAKEGLRERVMSYWNYKIKGEFDKSYGYEEPSYRKKVNLVGYIDSINTSAVKWKHAEIKAINKKGNTADVDINLRVEIVLPIVDRGRSVQMNAHLQDEWVKVGDVWYHRPPESGLRR